ncbi:ABC transporter ATP-binding protein [Ahrensia kielensis]|uniref:ABC transporter ATP-binding protein n=1 Tax=Ahrensia kielensis TaxID=76980 RepID=UPI000363FC97|nr:ABC transporter ATP-binding protein [Ahrensia kielensis]
MSPSPEIMFKGCFFIENKQLFDASFVMPAGQWTCLLGPSGVGKSTILRLLLGLKTGGHFKGEISTSDGQSIAGQISYMAQSDLLLPWLSVVENLMVGASLRGDTHDEERAMMLLDRVGLSDHGHKKPAALSGGMRQRAALARTLMEDRPIVLLDEPFSALDAGTRADMQELSAELLTGKTVLLVTHDPAEASRVADQILVMNKTGMVVWPAPELPAIRAVDAPETLLCQSKLLAHLRALAA